MGIRVVNIHVTLMVFTKVFVTDFNEISSEGISSVIFKILEKKIDVIPFIIKLFKIKVVELGIFEIQEKN